MRSGYVAPITFGVISENTRIRNATHQRADGVGELVLAEQPHGDQADQPCSPRRSTSVLPSRMPPSSRSVRVEQLGDAHRAAVALRTRRFSR